LPEGRFGFALWQAKADPEGLRDDYAEPVFKGWAKPGPIPPGALGGGPALEPGETLDAISGYFRLFQLAKGHRFSTDDVLTAWYGTMCCPAARSVLDLGSGVGAVGMIAAWRLPGARFVTVEAQAESVRLARKSARWNGLEDRYEIRHGRRKNLISSWPARRISRRAAVWKGIIRKKSPAVLRCGAILPITAPRPRRG
jgi:hypothetical protein